MRIERHVEVFVWHESPLVCAGLAATLREHSDLSVTVGESPIDGLVPDAGSFDVLVTDYATGLRHAEASAALRDAPGAQAPRLLVVTTKMGELDIRQAMALGVNGYLLLGCPAKRLVEGVQSLARGGRCYDDAVSARIADSLVYASLTKREHDVLQLISHGAGNKQIAKSLEIQLGTVKAHVKAILEKLQVRTRTHAVVVAEHRGLLRASPAEDLFDRFSDCLPGRGCLPKVALAEF